MLNIAPNAINTTGKGSTGVGLTAAVVVDRDTGERHLEAGAMVLGDRGIVCIDEFDKMNEVDRVAIHEVMEQQTVTIAKAGIHVSLNARCSVLAAANPIYGQYITDISTSKNIGFPDSLLSRFDLCFVVLDEHNPELDRKISEKVINNHMYNIDQSNYNFEDDDKVIEPQINTNTKKRINIYEKYNPYLHGKDKKEILTRDFLRKYIRFAKTRINPELTKISSDFISKSWMKLREKSMGDEWKGKIIPITVRSLESLIRLSTAFAKARLSQKIEKIDCIEALELLTQSLFNETDEKEEVEDILNDSNRQGNEMMEVEEEKITKKRGKKRDKKNLENSVRNSEIRSEEMTSDIGSVKRRSEKNDNELFDDLINAQISQDNISFVLSEEHSNFVFKSIFEKLTKAKNQFITIDEIWDYIKDKRETKSLKISNKNILYEICLKLEDEGKIFITEKKEIALV